MIGCLKLFNSNTPLSYLPSGKVSFNQLIEDVPVLYQDNVSGFNRKPPVTVGNIHKNFNNNLHEPQQQTFVVQGENWYVWGNQGAVITDNYHLFSDVSREFDNNIHSIFNQFKLAEPVQIDGCCTVLAASGSFVYYHWMFDILPRIAFLKRSGNFNSIDKFIINYHPNNYQTETLIRTGINSSRIIPSNDHWGFHVQAPKLLVPSMASANNRPSLAACLYLRELYAHEIKSIGKPLNIYIQRLSGRKVINENELLSFLAPLNFQIIHPEKLSVAAQASLFARARIIIGAHGAGFTNIVFCKPDTIIIDLFSTEWINPCYWIIAEHLKLKYSYLIGEHIQQTEKDKRADVMINLSKLKNLFVKLDIPDGG